MLQCVFHHAVECLYASLPLLRVVLDQIARSDIETVFHREECEATHMTPRDSKDKPLHHQLTPNEAHALLTPSAVR